MRKRQFLRKPINASPSIDAHDKKNNGKSSKEI
jgi:hypothetical protein